MHAVEGKFLGRRSERHVRVMLYRHLVKIGIRLMYFPTRDSRWVTFRGSKRGSSMAQWILLCSNCGEEFFHSEVVADRGVFAWATPKPTFPEGGLQLDCPSCQVSSLYQRHQLLYRAV